MKLKIAEVYSDLFPHGFHVYCSISMKAKRKSCLKINGKLLATVMYLKRVPEYHCCISESLSNYLKCGEIVDVELIGDEFSPLERISLQVISPINVDLKYYNLAHYILAGVVVGVGCQFEFEYLDITVRAKVMDTGLNYGTITVSTNVSFIHAPFHEAYCRPSIASVTLNIKEFNGVSETLLDELECFIEMDKECALSVGCLVYGAKGTGKTNLVREILKNTGLHIKYLKFTDLSETNELLTCENLSKAFEHRGILILDDLEQMKSDKVKQCLYNLFQIKRGSSIFVVGITPDICLLDQKLKSSNTFFTKMQLSLPEKDSRIKILRYHLSDSCMTGEGQALDEHLPALAARIQGFSLADISGMIRQAILLQNSEILTIEALYKASMLTTPANLAGFASKVCNSFLFRCKKSISKIFME